MTRLLGLGTSVPQYSAPQTTARDFMSRALTAGLEGIDAEATAWKVEAIYENSGIERRHSCVPDYLCTDPDQFEFFPANWALSPPPSTQVRMQWFQECVLDLAERAARRAIADAGISPQDINHIVFCTCTGFFAPGPDVLLARRLGLHDHVDRTQVGFMGCYAGFSGMRLSDRIARCDPDGVVLQIAAELCTLHFQTHPDTETIVANCLFADGCGAAIWGAGDHLPLGHASLLTGASAVGADSLDQMGWQIGNHGFEMTLSSRVPVTIEAELPAFVDAMLAKTSVTRDDLPRWAFHPGGRKIIEAGLQALALEPSALLTAFDVLRDFGNMSSATIFFVLERELAQASPDQPLVALGFGPGLTIEGAVLSCH